MYIRESLGTPEILSEIINENKISIFNIIDSKVDNSISINIDKSIELNKKKIEFKCIVRINFTFSKKSNNSGNVNFDECIKSNFQNCIINIFPSLIKEDKSSVLRCVLHELTHIYELYQIRKIYNTSKNWWKSKYLVDFDSRRVGKIPIIIYFRDLFYLSLPQEIRSRVSSLDMIQSIDDIKDTIEWKNYESLRDFNPENYFKDLINLYDLDQLFAIFNLFNNIMHIKCDIKSETDLINYFNKTKKYFNVVAENYRRKMIKVISESRVPIEYIHEDSNMIINYSDYLKMGMREHNLEILLEIGYKEFYQ